MYSSSFYSLHNLRNVNQFQYSLHSCRERQWHPTPVLLPGKFHGQRSLVGCSPWGRGEPDTTERLHFHFSLSCIGEGKGSPLQCSCLENPKDGSLVDCRLWGCTESDTTDMNQQEQQHVEKKKIHIPISEECVYSLSFQWCKIQALY